MAQSFTTADVNQISNAPGIFKFRPYGSVVAYTEAIFTNGTTFNFTPEQFTQEFDSTGDVYDVISNETGEVTFAYGKVYDLEFMEKLGGGLFSRTVISSGSQAVEDQVIAADWTDKDPIVLILVDSNGQTYKADGEPAITSVTASTAGVLAANDDYTIIPDQNSASGYSIVLNTAGTAGVTTSETVTIVFNSPTVVAQEKLTGGGVKNLDAIEGLIETELKDGTPVTIHFYKGYYNGNLSLPSGAVNNPEATVSDVTISLKNDTSRDEGDQVFEVILG